MYNSEKIDAKRCSPHREAGYVEIARVAGLGPAYVSLLLIVDVIKHRHIADSASGAQPTA
jgi:hypothetical protein